MDLSFSFVWTYITAKLSSRYDLKDNPFLGTHAAGSLRVRNGLRAARGSCLFDHHSEARLLLAHTVLLNIPPLSN